MNVHQIAENLPANLIEIAQKCEPNEFKAVLQHFELLQVNQIIGSGLHFAINDNRFYGLAGCFIHHLSIFLGVIGIDHTLTARHNNARNALIQRAKRSVNLSPPENLDDYEDKCETLINSVCDITTALQANGFTHHQLFGNLSVGAFRKVFYNHLMK